MKNILLWAGIAVLAFQDYFKKQPVKPTRRQQFLQTGETSQVFIDGVSNGIVICSGCGWDWEISDGGNDPYICHKCGHDNK